MHAIATDVVVQDNGLHRKGLHTLSSAQTSERQRTGVTWSFSEMDISRRTSRDSSQGVLHSEQRKTDKARNAQSFDTVGLFPTAASI
jgi:hypothetical protein